MFDKIFIAVTQVFKKSFNILEVPRPPNKKYFWVEDEAVLNKVPAHRKWAMETVPYIPKIPQCQGNAGTEPRTVTLFSWQSRAVDH